MNVQCPQCTQRYKVDDSKIRGRSAKIRCPRCDHRFVVSREGKEADPPTRDFDTVDWAALGLNWQVKKGLGVTYPVRGPSELRQFLTEGQVDTWDRLSHDGRRWTAIELISDLDQHFSEIYERASSGALTEPEPEAPEDTPQEDVDDAPTAIVGRGSSLAFEIRQAVHAESTPVPVTKRSRDSEPPFKAPPPEEPILPPMLEDLDLLGPPVAKSPEAVPEAIEAEEDDAPSQPSASVAPARPAAPPPEPAAAPRLYDPAPLDPPAQRAPSSGPSGRQPAKPAPAQRPRPVPKPSAPAVVVEDNRIQRMVMMLVGSSLVAVLLVVLVLGWMGML